jgi:hypothetical protein
MEKNTKIKITAPVTLYITFDPKNPTVCGEGCTHYYDVYIPDKKDNNAFCVFGRLRWCKDGNSTYRHKNCLAARQLKD